MNDARDEVPPSDPSAAQLEGARAAFERGNYAEVRRLAVPLTKSTDGPVAEGARQLLEQLAPAPLVKYLLLLTFLLLTFVTIIAYLK